MVTQMLTGQAMKITTIPLQETFILLTKGSVSWLSNKQATAALSTEKAEYVAIWLRRLLTDVGEPLEDPIVINEGSQGAITMAKNPVGHARTSHIDTSYYFVRRSVKRSDHFEICSYW